MSAEKSGDKSVDVSRNIQSKLLLIKEFRDER
jgi:hypothetical protein